MFRIPFTTILFLISTSFVAANDNPDLPPIKSLTNLNFKPAVGINALPRKPLIFKSAEDLKDVLQEDGAAKLGKQVDFDKQVVLVFAWQGSGQDKLTYAVLESFPEQVVFKFAPGRTKDLRKHIYAFALRSNVKWKWNSAKPAGKRRKPNPAMAEIEDDPKLPRVLLIGDSISIGYTVPTRELLKGKANVHRPLTNCGPTTKGLAEIDRWLGDGEWDIIHFNWGLHDLKYLGPNGENLADPKASGSKQQVPLDQYEKNLDKLVARLKKTEARLIWRNTTPVPPGSKGRVVGDSAKYNEAAARVMKKHSIPTQDLFTFAKQRMDKIMRKANVHFFPAGSKLLAQEVASAIEKAMKVYRSPNGKAFPAHWGQPPRLQTRDLRPLPGGYGRGSSTLANWIQENLDRDEK